MKTGIIYMATSPSGKSYIGQTIQKLKYRINRHYKDANSYSFAFARAIIKYGKNNWQWNILYENIPRHQLSNMEKWCIANYNTYNNGYNSTLGGEDHTLNNPITLKERSKRLKGKKRKKHSLRMTGKGNPMYGKTSAMKGKKHTAETIKKISNNRCKKEYIIINPEGDTIIVRNLNKFCLENKLTPSMMYDLVKNNSKEYKGWKCSSK